jgi:hypothetical protein
LYEIAVSFPVGPLSHPYITTNSNTATLLSTYAAEMSTLCQAWKLLGTEYNKGLRLQLHSPIEGGFWILRRVHGNLRFAVQSRLLISIFLWLVGLFIKVEAQTIGTFMTNSKVLENKVACFRWSIQVRHPRDGHTGQHWVLGRSRRRDTTISNGTSLFQSCEKEEVRIVCERDIVLASIRVDLEDLEFDNGWRINRSSVGRCYKELAPSKAHQTTINSYTLPQIHMLSRVLVVA